MPVEPTPRRSRVSLGMVLKAIRIHQWSKNILVLVPIVLAHRVLDSHFLLNGVRAFFAFSFCASAMYLLNDILDLPSDRRHPTKRFRPLASGNFPIPAALALALAFLVCGAALTPPGNATYLLLIYVVSVVAYSAYFKRMLMADVLLLAGFYTIRLLYGGAATKIPVSVWAIAFSMFMFVSLALVKRISELRLGLANDLQEESRRGYRVTDLSVLLALCAASGFVSALVVVLYVRSPEVAAIYAHPQLLLAIFPLLAFWQSRLLILANRGEIPDDPVVFSLLDSPSRIVAAAVVLVLVLAA